MCFFGDLNQNINIFLITFSFQKSVPTVAMPMIDYNTRKI